jgi:hypothetical protein
MGLQREVDRHSGRSWPRSFFPVPSTMASISRFQTPASTSSSLRTFSSTSSGYLDCCRDAQGRAGRRRIDPRHADFVVAAVDVARPLRLLRRRAFQRVTRVGGRRALRSSRAAPRPAPPSVLRSGP